MSKIDRLDFRKIYEGKQDFPNPPLEGCPDDLSAIEYVVEKKINELVDTVNKLTEDSGEKKYDMSGKEHTCGLNFYCKGCYDIGYGEGVKDCNGSGVKGEEKKYTCPTCQITQPDNWCGGCGKVIEPKTLEQIINDEVILFYAVTSKKKDNYTIGHYLAFAIRTYIKEIAEGMQGELKANHTHRQRARVVIHNQALNDLVGRI